MHSTLNFVVFVLELFFQLAASGSLPDVLKRNSSQIPPSTLNVSTIESELGPRLSKTASIHFPNNPDFSNLTETWSSATGSDFAVVVIPAIDEDVAETVKFANRYNISFLAVNKGHGSASALSNVESGISIYVRALSDIIIAGDGKSAQLGGGTYVDEVIDYLADHDKTTATGSCACIGMMGPGLGGGMGPYEGHFGLVLDNIIDMTVVIADGSKITVSESSHPDLYWGMRGAGHNFGIVTSFNYKIYDQPVVDWFVATLVFTQDKLEAVFEQMNVFGNDGNQPVEATVWILYLLIPEISTTEPVLSWQLRFAGTESQADSILSPFLALNPASVTNVTTPYTGVAHASSAGLQDPICQDGLSRKMYPVGLQNYNVTTNRAIYSLFSTMVNEQPSLNSSIVQFESYPVQGMKAVDPASTAYAHRDDNILVSYSVFYVADPNGDVLADTYGHQARTLFYDGVAPGYPLNAYVNYASSDETPEQIYGYEPWRLQRLRALKKQYDPLGKFNFYNPIG